MDTLLTTDPGEAAALVRRGGLVAFPTETVYGLGADAGDPKAVRRIFESKGRPADNPLIVHVSDRGQIDPLVRGVSEYAAQLMDAFFPGPLTLVFTRSKQVPDEVTAGLDTVAVRMPDHPVARRFLQAAGRPVAAP
ncbi:MAG: threonylcarbamoyl-AMP synthase, partial [Rhodothermales bacterium]|nr:threonylcarbamoyl-AMP synthase [Rhodothermales bacterium]